MKQQTPSRFAHCIVVADPASAIGFCTDVFDAEIILRECLLDGQVLTAELRIGTDMFTVTLTVDAAFPADYPVEAPCLPAVETADVDELLARARAAGGDIEPATEAGQCAVVRDPGGQRWAIVASAV